jgi:diguanylate cyclase (GGDEF)-like protein
MSVSQSTVVHLLTSFWKREMARTKLSLLNIRDSNYPITIFNDGVKDELSPYNNSCTLTTSISIFGEEIGFISTYHSINTDIEEDDESSFYILPPLVAPALYRGYLEKKSRHLAQTDGLTGVANRRSFHEQLNKEIMRAIRNNTTISFLMMDIDFFKKINDTYGHMIGDDVLKKLVKTTEKIIRVYDFFARFGGEEFTIVLPDTDIKGANALAERIREAIEKASVSINNEERINFTVSIGVSSYCGVETNLSAGCDTPIKQISETLIKNSDTAMYSAKQNGRNRIYYFDEDAGIPVHYQGG